MFRSIIAALGASFVALILAGSVLGAPITKQNGTSPAFQSFTSICAVPGYANYGECGGSTTTFSGVTGKVNAVQAQPFVYNLGISFAGLVPGESYTLYQNLNGVFTAVGLGFADLAGQIEFGYQATLHDTDMLAWDLNHNGGTTVVTSYWSGQALSPAGEQGPLVVVPTALIRVVKDTVPTADGSKWSFVVTDGATITYRQYADQDVPFTTGYIAVTNPTHFEIDEWAGAGTDFRDYTESVSCVEGAGGAVVTPIAGGFYTGPGPTERLYTYFSAAAGHVYTCAFTNTHGVTAAVKDVTASPGTTFQCSAGATGGSATSSTIVWTAVGTQVRAEIHIVGALPNRTFDVWVEQYQGTCPPGTSTPSNPAAVTTDGSGNATATILFTPASGATAYWLSLWTPAGSLTGVQVLRSEAVSLS